MKKRRWVYAFLILAAFCTLVAGVLMATWKRLPLQQLLSSSLIQKGATAVVGDQHRDVISALPILLGFHGPKTYLLLFENNTELRPGGGFIGVYAVVRMDEGHVNVLKVEGTEVLDRGAPKDWNVTPPKILTDQLKVSRWYFRDSNWSPDFATSAQQALEFFRAEEGAASGEIDAVVAITPTVLEELMKLTGPFTIQDIKFTADNVTEKLEYEVEYGYDDRGVERINRKQIISPFMDALISHIKDTAFTHAGDYLSLVGRLVEQKQIMAYSRETDLHALIEQERADGRVADTTGDYLLWVDANLAALKTDRVMRRQLSYDFTTDGKPSTVAVASMTYTNQGNFDWRTTRYRTYARLYVPLGSVLRGAMIQDKDGFLIKNIAAKDIDQGQELGKQWFGTFVTIEPGETKSLQFIYELSPSIQEQIRTGTYHLLVQKQLGSLSMELTLQLYFGKNIQAAAPPEAKEDWGNTGYQLKTDLNIDRQFTVTF